MKQSKPPSRQPVQKVRRSTKRSKDGADREREREKKAVQSGDDDCPKVEPKKQFLQNETLNNFNKMAESDVGQATDPTKFLEKPTRADPRFRWCEKILMMKPQKINKDFIEVKGYKPGKITQVHYEKNYDRNRYDDIVCIDATRVVLKERPQDDNYIHANWMVMPDNQRYISTQGPISSTIEDFWHMLYTEKSNVVVMLTGLVDDKDEKVSKCSCYYPLTSSEVVTFGIYKITRKSHEKEPFHGINWYTLQVDRIDGTGTGPFTVNHFIYDTWTDHTAPESAIPAVGLFKLSRKLSAGLPITVHCSAGIGRTATFVGIDYASQRIVEKGDKFSMVDVIKDLRSMRLHAIQSAVQYLFLHVCLIELYAQEDVVPKTGKYLVFMKNYQTVLKRFIEKNRNILSKQQGGGGGGQTSRVEPRAGGSELQPKSGNSILPKPPKDPNPVSQ